MTAISQTAPADVLVPVNPATLVPVRSSPTTPPEALGEIVVEDPTVLAGEPASSRIRREEALGPVVTVVRTENDSGGIRRNDTPFGRGVRVWARDRDRGRKVLR